MGWASACGPCVAIDASSLADSVRTIPAAVWALWAMLSLWVVLDSGRLVRTNRFRVDPLGPAAVLLSALGLLNIISALGALFILSRP